MPENALFFILSVISAYKVRLDISGPPRFPDEQASGRIKDVDGGDDFNAILAARLKRRRVETPSIEPMPKSDSPPPNCPWQIQCTLDDDDSKGKVIKTVAQVNNDIKPVKLTPKLDTLPPNGRQQNQCTFDDNDIKPVMPIVSAETQSMGSQTPPPNDLVTIDSEGTARLDNDTKLVEPMESSPPKDKVDQDQCASDNKDKDSVLTDLDMHDDHHIGANAPLTVNELKMMTEDVSHTNTDTVRVDAPGVPKPKRGRKAAQAEATTTKGTSNAHTDTDDVPRAKKGKKAGGLSEVSETKAKKGRKTGTGSKKKR